MRAAPSGKRISDDRDVYRCSCPSVASGEPGERARLLAVGLDGPAPELNTRGLVGPRVIVFDVVVVVNGGLS
jgi:hypothetical protein